MDKNTDTESKIIKAATKVFTKKGLYGARMQEIADEAGINKALLHYYFRSKDQLFDAIFIDLQKSFIKPLIELLNRDIPLEKKVELLVEKYIDNFSNNSSLPLFMLFELNQEPQKGEVIFRNIKNLKDSKFFMEVSSQSQSLYEFQHLHNVLNIISLVIFPLIAKPILIHGMSLTEEQYKGFLEERKKVLPDLINKYLKSTQNEKP